MEIIRIQDKYNANKVWLVKRYKCGHYAVNQEVCGKPFYKSFRRMTKSYIDSIIESEVKS
ncbi:MAG TPA: hypothetical protein DEP65_01850 [Ruminococcus sp.]|nr:hypothetical protein [Ruminococcus sp.]